MNRLRALTVGVVGLLIMVAPPARVDAAPDFELPAVQLRIALDRVLAEHAFLVVEAMRTGVQQGPQFEVAAQVVEENTLDILDLVDAAYGSEAARAFAELWRNHIAYLVDYARAAANGDEDGQALADAQLEAYVDQFTALLSSANPTLSPDVIRGLIAEHRQQLEQIGSFVSADYGDAYGAMRDTFDHMFAVGDGLALGILGQYSDRFPGQSTAFSPALELRLALDRLLGEHTFLAAMAMRAGLENAADLDAAVGALDANTAELADQVGVIYGPDAGAAFSQLWTDHVDAYLAYVDATAAGDQAGQETARAALETYRSDFGSFLAGANPLLDESALSSLIQVHTDQLLDQVTAYSDGDHGAAYRTLREAYAHTAELAAGLGGAIAEQFPERYPDTAMEGFVRSIGNPKPTML